jgi:hypothetical protein
MGIGGRGIAVAACQLGADLATARTDSDSFRRTSAAARCGPLGGQLLARSFSASVSASSMA